MNCSSHKFIVIRNINKHSRRPIMATIFIRLLIPAAVIASTGARANETTLCTFGQKERVISVIYQNQESKLPCEVHYKKNGKTETLWAAQHNAGYCEEKAKAFIQKQTGWGWKCSNTTSENAPAATNTNQVKTQ